MMELAEVLNLLMFHSKLKVSGLGSLIASRRSQVSGPKHVAVNGRISVVLNRSAVASVR